MINEITYSKRPAGIGARRWRLHRSKVKIWALATSAKMLKSGQVIFSPASTNLLAAVIPVTLPPGYHIIGSPVARRVVDFGDMFGRGLYEQYNLVPDVKHYQEQQQDDGSWVETGTMIEGPADGGFWTMGALINPDDTLRDYYRMRVDLT